MYVNICHVTFIAILKLRFPNTGEINMPHYHNIVYGPGTVISGRRPLGAEREHQRLVTPTKHPLATPPSPPLLLLSASLCSLPLFLLPSNPPEGIVGTHSWM